MFTTPEIIPNDNEVCIKSNNVTNISLHKWYQV